MSDTTGWAPLALLILQTLLSLALLAHAVLQLWLARASRAAPATGSPAPSGELPPVTVQLPVFNERTVVERLIANVACLDYPPDRLEVQVLDDSTDETSALVAEALARLPQRGVAWRHIRRGSRDGFKAGALADGLARAGGVLVAVLDADFISTPGFLRAMVPYFDDPAVGAVQSRWGHLNSSASLLTRIQTYLLDTHFTVEQAGRSRLGCFVNFNGSAGMWRAAAIRDSGGWSSATLTEDLDLSYRAQLRGWRIVYVDRVLASAELPQTLAALRVQQARWMRGVAQDLRSLAPRVVAAGLPGRVKAHALAHLAESGLYLVTLGVPLLGALIAVLDPPAAIGRIAAAPPIFLLGVAMLFAVYRAAVAADRPGLREYARYAGLWLVFVIFSLGISAHNGAAALRGYIGGEAAFERTPKSGVAARTAYKAAVGVRAIAPDLAALLVLGLLLVVGMLRGVLPAQWLAVLAFCAILAVAAATVRTGPLRSVARVAAILEP